MVGGKADTCGGLSIDTAFLFGNGAEGVVAVEPEAVFHGWPQARRESLPGGTRWSGSRAGAKCRSGWNQAFLTERQRRKKGLTALRKRIIRQTNERVDGGHCLSFNALIMGINDGIPNLSAECRMNYKRYFRVLPKISGKKSIFAKLYAYSHII